MSDKTDLYRCSRTRACGWLGRDGDRTSRRDKPGVWTLICPDCGCDSFYITENVPVLPERKLSPQQKIATLQRELKAAWAQRDAAMAELEQLKSTTVPVEVKAHERTDGWHGVGAARFSDYRVGLGAVSGSTELEVLLAWEQRLADAHAKAKEARIDSKEAQG